MNGDMHMFAMPRHGLVDRVVDDFVDEVMQAARGGIADVHTRAEANGLDPFEDADIGPGVGAISGVVSNFGFDGRCIGVAQFHRGHPSVLENQGRISFTATWPTSRPSITTGTRSSEPYTFVVL